MTQIESDDVPVTSVFLNLVKLLHGSRTRFLAETHIAEDLGLPAPKDYWERCNDLFFNEFGAQFKAAGLSLNEITFRSLMHLELDVEVMRTKFSDLPLLFAFNPWLHMGKGGIKRVEQELQHERQHA